MKSKELFERGCIDVEDDITFRTHADVLRLFGREHKVFQLAFAKHPQEDGVHIWFPKFYQDDDWENTFGLNQDNVFERRKHDNEGYVRELLEHPDRHKRILFAKIVDRFGDEVYQFKGVYHLDHELTGKAKKAAYRRVSMKVKIYPMDA